MKRFAPVLIIAVVALLGLLLYAARSMPSRQFNERVTFNEFDHNPYGASVAYQMIPRLFNNISPRREFNSPGSWQTLNSEAGQQLLIIAVMNFDPEPYEMSSLMAFARNGNTVFITANNYSPFAQQYLGIRKPFWMPEKDSLEFTPSQPLPFAGKHYSYPGFSASGNLEPKNALATTLAGDKTNNPSFIQYTIGSGKVCILLDPFVISNYFLLRKNNIEALQSITSVMASNLEKVSWDKYFASHRSSSGNREPEEPNWFKQIIQYPAFAWAFFTALAFLILFFALRMRRKQREIPYIHKPKNESLEFVKVLGRLYREKGDHYGLAVKMGTFFKDYVRTNYYMNSHTLDEAFALTLHAKSGYPQAAINDIVYFINTLNDRTTVSSSDLIEFHQRLEKFYQQA